MTDHTSDSRAESAREPINLKVYTGNWRPGSGTRISFDLKLQVEVTSSIMIVVSTSAKWGVHTYDKYAKSGLVTILHIAKGLTYFFAYSAYCFTYFIVYSTYCIAYSAYCNAYSTYENGYVHIPSGILPT